ncbi:hypothetical protein [Atlantibacter hermannii]|uniref:hypothetical protein n=1 Tax=Atlantibacter hermannii TaxID=565 RepID=UPI00289D0EA7|nr:hypothetical protein [Atlantibacter hermannii]
MKRVYFDQNIWIDIEEERENLSASFIQEIINRDKIQLVYSPANCEEICNAFRSNNIKNKISDDRKNKRISLISELTKNTEIVPYPSLLFNAIASPFGKSGPQIINEDPFICYQRVEKHYKSNEIAEKNQQLIIKSGKNVDQKTKNKLSNLDPIKDILKNNIGHELLSNKVLWKTIYGEALIKLLQQNEIEHPITEDKLPIIVREVRILVKNIDYYISIVNSNLSKSNIFNHISYSYNLMETYIDSIVQTLIELGYASENKFMSSLHDISHLIYGSYCDYFITRDEKLIKKAKPTYKYIGSSAQVI